MPGAGRARGRRAPRAQPFADALRRRPRPREEGMKATIPLVARKGRASYLGENGAPGTRTPAPRRRGS